MALTPPGSRCSSTDDNDNNIYLTDPFWAPPAPDSQNFPTTLMVASRRVQVRDESDVLASGEHLTTSLYLILLEHVSKARANICRVLDSGLNQCSTPFVIDFAASLSVMADITQASPAPVSKHLKPPPPAPVRRIAQCTHLTMDRMYGENKCNICGRIPSLGWLYTCRQDHQLGSREDLHEVTDYAPDEHDYFDVMMRRAASLGMQRPVLLQIGRGLYTFDQVNTLIKQKEHLIAVIKDAQLPTQLATPPVSPIASCSTSANTTTAIANKALAPTPRNTGRRELDSFTPNKSAAYTDVERLPMTPIDTPKDTTSRNTRMSPTRQRHKSSSGRPKCRFQACHTCRPFFTDRLHTLSFEAVFNDEISAVTEKDIKQLPFCDPDVVRYIGLREPPLPLPETTHSQESLDLMLQQSFDSDDDWSPISGTESEGEGDYGDREACPMMSSMTYSQGAARDDVVRGTPTHDGQDSHTRQTGQILIVSRTGTSSSTASSISLPTPVLGEADAHAQPFDMALNSRTRKTVSHIGVFPDEEGQRGLEASRKPSSDSLGSEIEVEGGVALTEEAVGMGLPDIITHV